MQGHKFNQRDAARAAEPDNLNRFQRDALRRGVKSSAPFPGSTVRTPASDERLNAFQRHDQAQASAATSAPATPEEEFAADRTNRFQKNDAARIQARKASNNVKVRQDRIDEKRKQWVGPGRLTPLDPKTAELKAASDADRASRRTSTPAQKPWVPTPATMAAIVSGWLASKSAGTYHPSDFNNANLKNIFWAGFFSDAWELSLEGFQLAFEWMVANAYYDDVPSRTNAAGQLIRPRGTQNLFALPKVYPTFKFPDEIAADDQAAAEAAVAQSLAERKAAEQTPFAELQQKVRKDFKPTPAQSLVAQ